MRWPARSTRDAFVALLASIILATLLVACGFSAADPAAPLVIVETRGGECVAGPCGQTVTLQRDGHVHVAAKPPNDLGIVPPEQVAAIEAAIKLTDFATLRSHPFTGACPTAFDGQELIFEFSAPAGIERIDSCEVDIDYGLPLFVAVSTALGPFVPLTVS